MQAEGEQSNYNKSFFLFNLRWHVEVLPFSRQFNKLYICMYRDFTAQIQCAVLIEYVLIVQQWQRH